MFFSDRITFHNLFSKLTAEEAAKRAEQDAEHMAKVAAARAKMAEMGIQDIRPIIKVSRKRRANIISNSAALVSD
jgi:hypothetical protein